MEQLEVKKQKEWEHVSDLSASSIRLQTRRSPTPLCPVCPMPFSVAKEAIIVDPPLNSDVL